LKFLFWREKIIIFLNFGAKNNMFYFGAKKSKF
jgi:hypothetical protein